MRRSRPLICVLFCVCVLIGLFLAKAAHSQAPSPQAGLSLNRGVPNVPTPPPLAQPNSQGSAFLSQAIVAVGAGLPASDVTLVGQITIFMPGGKTNNGTITMVARGDSQAEVTMSLATGTSTEVRSAPSGGVPVEMRTAADGTVTHNPTSSLFTPHPAWFFPQFVFGAQPQSNLSSAFIGSETRAGVPVNHIEVWQLPSSSSATAMPATSMQHFTQYDVYLDPATSLPVSMVYWVQPIYPNDPHAKFFHSDNRVPVEIQFSNYQAVQGIPVPHQLKAFLQGRQIYSIQLSSATINSGVLIPAVY
jgi:hypothetical protein